MVLIRTDCHAWQCYHQSVFYIRYIIINHRLISILSPCINRYMSRNMTKPTKMARVPSKDSDQPGHPPSLIRVFIVRMKKAWVLSYYHVQTRELMRGKHVTFFASITNYTWFRETEHRVVFDHAVTNNGLAYTGSSCFPCRRYLRIRRDSGTPFWWHMWTFGEKWSTTCKS